MLFRSTRGAAAAPVQKPADTVKPVQKPADTVKDEHPDIAGGIANGTWGAAPTAKPNDGSAAASGSGATSAIPQTSDNFPYEVLSILACLAVGGFSVVSVAGGYFCKRNGFIFKISKPAVIFKPDKRFRLNKFAFCGYVSYESGASGDRICVQKAYSGEFLGIVRLIIMPEQLISAADCQKNRHIITRFEQRCLMFLQFL